MRSQIRVVSPSGRMIRRRWPTLLRGWLLALSLSLLTAPATAGSFSDAVKFLEHHLAPLRSNPFLQSSARPCHIGVSHCFLPAAATSKPKHASLFDSAEPVDGASRPVLLELRTAHRGPLAHHWLETETSAGRVTIGFGPATLPFIDAGQVALQDQLGNVERISGMHPVPPLGLPPLNYRYARHPGDGHAVGKPIVLTMAQSEAFVQHIRQKKFVGPYIPFFHDCRTFVCSAQAGLRRKSSLPCYLLLKGYW